MERSLAIYAHRIPSCRADFQGTAQRLLEWKIHVGAAEVGLRKIHLIQHDHDA